MRKSRKFIINSLLLATFLGTASIPLTSCSQSNSSNSIDYANFDYTQLLNFTRTTYGFWEVSAKKDELNGITKIVIPSSYREANHASSSVISIAKEAFKDCTSLKSIVIPDTIQYVGSQAFDGCDSLKYNEYDNAYYLGNENNPYVVLVKAKSTNIQSCIINSECKAICAYAFSNCKNLTNIVIPDKITSIGSCAFFSCVSLTSVVLPLSMKSIGLRAFDYCDNITCVYFKGAYYEEKITIDDYNYHFKSALYWYYYSEDKPLGDTHKHWHYVDGVPTAW